MGDGACYGNNSATWTVRTGIHVEDEQHVGVRVLCLRPAGDGVGAAIRVSYFFRRPPLALVLLLSCRLSQAASAFGSGGAIGLE